MVGLTLTSNTISLRDLVVESLNLFNSLLGLSREEKANPIYLNADTCKKSTKLPRSIRIWHTWNLDTKSSNTKASSCGVATCFKSVRENVNPTFQILITRLKGVISYTYLLTSSVLATIRIIARPLHLDSHSQSNDPPWITNMVGGEGYITKICWPDCLDLETWIFPMVDATMLTIKEKNQPWTRDY